jgi:L,D-peptidoglycan transpeptidase YkuD (ErfK/YbiS/YcfS/YnhG family)
MTLWHVHPQGFLTGKGQHWRCALGRNGIRLDKREGDGATPVGDFPLRWLYYRADRVFPPPNLTLKHIPLHPRLGWCDAPQHPLYNRPIERPFSARHEELWRQDRLYDYILVIGHNDDPVEAGAGSAIFLHLATEEYSPTQGCIALSLDDFEAFLCLLTPQCRLIIPPP